MKQLLVLTFTLFLLTSCYNSKPKVIYDTTTHESADSILIDTTATRIAGLPIHFDSTNYLIHPIGSYKPEKDGGRLSISSSSYKTGLGRMSFVYKNRNTVSGDINNLKFQHLDSTTFSTLTNKQIKIRSFTRVKSKCGNDTDGILIYRISDKDTNKDMKLNDSDIESLYISKLNGQNLKKLSPEWHELIEWELMKIKHRIYFITSEDIDKNGEFNTSDKLHYYYIDLGCNDRNVIEYNPL